MKIRDALGILVIVFLSLFACSKAWDNDELELFDLVEEVNQNFYELMGVSNEADNKEIKKAFRKLSLVLHPDKNDAPDADIKFRQLVAVYEVLSDEKKRNHYNDVLVNGLPDWKHVVYYYRRVRKMGLLEMGVILLLILTVGQYIVLWAAYAEKKYTAEQLISSKMKKSQKKQKKGKEGDPAQNILIDFPKPSVFDLLPFQTVRFVWLCITGAPQAVQLFREMMEESKRQQLEAAEETSDDSAVEEEDPEEKRQRRARRRKTFVPPELGPEEPNALLEASNEGNPEMPVTVPKKLISGGLWTDDDLLELGRLIKKYPGGTPERWEKIADAMCRSVPEVTHMARKVMEDLIRPTAVLGGEEGEDGAAVSAEPVEVRPTKVKTKGGKQARGVNEEASEKTAIKSVWKQQQQKALENALTKYPKGTSDRWIKISNCVPEKSMEECMQRYKELVEVVKKKKEQQQATENTSETNSQITESTNQPPSVCLPPAQVLAPTESQ